MNDIVSQRTLSVHKEHELLLSLERAGLGSAEAQQVIESKDNRLAQEIISLISSDGTLTHQQAREIMGENFFGIEEWRAIFQAGFSDEQLQQIAKFPWGEDVLNLPCPFEHIHPIKDTHFAFLGLENLNSSPLTIIELRNLPLAPGKQRFPEGPWYGRKFANKTTCGLRWYLMLKRAVPHTEDSTFEDSIKYYFKDGYELPLAVEWITKEILFYWSQREIGPYYFGRCRDIFRKPNERVVVGNLSIKYCSDKEGLWNVAMFASRKLPNTTQG